MLIPSNNLAKLGVGAAHSTRVQLADQLFFPIAVDFDNPSMPMNGGRIGNRSGSPTRLTSAGIAGNTAGYNADYSFLSGDPASVIRTMTSDGPIFAVTYYNGGGQITIENPIAGAVGANVDYGNIPRYIIKSDGIIYDLLEIRGTDSSGSPPPAGPWQHWEFAAAQVGSGYTAGTNTYDPATAAIDTARYPNVTGGFTANAITPDHYVRAVGRISFRAKAGASSAAIQEQLGRAQNMLDTMSRLLRSLHDEAKGPFANIGLR
jgi:hypothetical protein